MRLGMPYVAAHSRLARIASFERSEEGQEIWKLKADDRYERLIVGFDAARHVRYVTALAKQDGQPIDYGQIAEVSSAIRASGPGNNVKLTWKARDRKAGFDYLVIAYGHDAHRLSSYSVKRLGARGEEEEEEESTAHTQH